MKDSKGNETKLDARMESFKGGQIDPPLPPLTAPYILDWLMDVGPAEQTGMGQVPIGWRTIDAWAARTFSRPSAWEARILRRLSAEYLAELHAAEDHMRPAPWSPSRAEVGPANEEARLRAVLG